MNTRSEPPMQAADWFSQFDDFTYNPIETVQTNFTRLAKVRKWGAKLKSKRWVQCQTALFGSLYGTDTTKLEIWQELCRDVLIDEPPNSITKCKELLGSRQVLVNLVNLVEHRMSGEPVIRFSCYRAWREYTVQGRTYPRKAAKEDGFIKALLRKL
ncbi:hypothetical protein EK21DRAFT_104952 [Setomelanomma holmii]|uniref:Uncharacterized protein n=1 Tax=Setomelanomma holmii TaxID=210430 RepID=A0A9P4LHC2_9PLEO|nr:hypothetical protein EK21DRAFT_104952 [Setomelanomma holmii]